MPKFKKISRREARILTVTVILSFLYLFQISAVDPLVAFLERLSSQMDQQKTAIGQYLRTMTEKERILREMQVYQAYMKSPEGADSAEKEKEAEDATLLTEIEKMAGQQGVSVSTLAPQGARQMHWMREYRVEIETQSSQKALIRFLYALQSADTLFYPEKIRITAAKAKEGGNITAQMTWVKAVIFSGRGR